MFAEQHGAFTAAGLSSTPLPCSVTVSSMRDFHQLPIVRAGPEEAVRQGGGHLELRSHPVHPAERGSPPFWGETEQQIFDAVAKGHIDFKTDPWPNVSSEAKDAVRVMLQQASLGAA